MSSKTNQIPLPSFVRGLDAIGEISISLTLNSQPSCSYQLVSDIPFSTRLTDNDIKYNIYSCYYRVQNANETIDVVTGKHLLNVSLEGWYRPLLEKEVLVGDNGNNRTSLNQTAILAGVSIDGVNTGRKKIVSQPYLTTLGSELSQYLSDEGLTVIFDTGIRCVEEGVSGTLSIPPSDILNIDINHKQEHTHKFRLLPQYLEFKTEKQINDQTEDSVSQVPVFEIIPRPQRTVVIDPEDVVSAPVTGLIRTLDMNFDMSGKTKIKEITRYEGEKTISKEVITYGYAYTTNGVGLSLNDNFAFSGNYEYYWQIVESYNINYLYDDGYYVGYDKFGYKLSRYKTETDAFEALEASLSTDPEIQLEGSFYKFIKVPIVEYERLDLEAYSNYYKDAIPTADQIYIEYEKYNERTKRFDTKYAKDKTYTLPMFVKKRLMYSRCFDWVSVPQSIADFSGQVLTTGEEKKEISTIDILPSNSTIRSSEAVDSYIEFREIEAMQDANFSNHIKTSEESFNFGRPGESEYFQQYQRVEINASTQEEVLDPQKWTVSAGVSSNISLPTGTVVIERATGIRDAVNILQKQINNQHKFENGEFTVTTFFNVNAKPNSKLAVYYNGRSCIGTIKSVNHSIKILGKNIAVGTTTITASIAGQAPIHIDLNKESRPPTPSSFFPGRTRKSFTSVVNYLISAVPGRGSF